jgi:hypothetical protein
MTEAVSSGAKTLVNVGLPTAPAALHSTAQGASEV